MFVFLIVMNSATRKLKLHNVQELKDKGGDSKYKKRSGSQSIQF